MLKTSLGRLRLIGMAEGISLLLLLFICTPLKYGFDIPEPTKVIGMIHGLLFTIYVLVVLLSATELKFSVKTIAILLAASIIPFGTFYTDKHYLNPQP